MGVHYQYDDGGPDSVWYVSLWFLLVIIAVIVLAIVWFTVARGPRPEMQAEAPPQKADASHGRLPPSVVPALLISRSAGVGSPTESV